jgi:opacity protein-like surface antigen
MKTTAAAVVVLLAWAATPAGAADQKPQTSWNGVAELRYRVDAPAEGDASQGGEVVAGRLAAKAQWPDAGGGFLQLHGTDREVRLLDAEAWMHLTSDIRLRLGQFKTPVSAEFLVGYTRLVFIRRAWTVGIAPRRRVGAELDWTREVGGGWTLDVRAGAWNPRERQVSEAAGALLGGRVALMKDAWTVHLGGAGHVGPATVEGERVVPNNGPVLAAVLFDDGVWRSIVEGVVAVDAEADDAPFGVHAELARRLGDWQPAIGWDTARRIADVEHRAQVALNRYAASDHLMLTLQYTASLLEAGTGHEGAVQLQAAF